MSDNKLYVGNLSHSVAALEEAEQLKELFSGYGNVKHVNVIKGKHYGFVEMSNQAEANKAKQELNGLKFKGCALEVNKVRPRAAKRGWGRR
jgi:RNA recognition motif-containing protein